MVLSALIGHYAKQNILLYLGRRDNYKPKPCITTWWHWTSQCCRVQCVSHHLKTLHVSLFNLVSCPKNNILKLIDKNLLIYGYTLLICTFEILIGVIFKLWPKSNTEGDFQLCSSGWQATQVWSFDQYTNDTKLSHSPFWILRLQMLTGRRLIKLFIKWPD